MEVHDILGKKPKVHWKTGYKSDIGKVREINEDSFYLDQEGGIFVVADGMGGHEGGEVASEMAVKIIPESLKDTISKDALEENIYDVIMKALLKANEGIRMKAEEDPLLRGMGTTIVLALCHSDDIYISHVGDSRAYLIRNRSIKQLTEDHSVVVQMVKAGNITKEEAKTHRFKHMLSQALGTSIHIAPDIQKFRWEKEDYILLCTDGLTDMLDDQELLSTVLECSEGEPEEGCEMLVDLANKKGGKDNITAILLYKNC